MFSSTKLSFPVGWAGLSLLGWTFSGCVVCFFLPTSWRWALVGHPSPLTPDEWRFHLGSNKTQAGSLFCVKEKAPHLDSHHPDGLSVCRRKKPIPMVVQRWAGVYDDGPPLNHHWEAPRVGHFTAREMTEKCCPWPDVRAKTRLQNNTQPERRLICPT